MKSASTVGLFIAILALAAALRFWGIGTESLWLDETISVKLAQSSPAQLLVLTAQDIHPPLYYLLLRGWLIFGRSEAAVRSLSAAAGVLAVAALYALGRQLWSAGVGLVVALFLAVSPLHIQYAQEARMYALVTLWATLSSWLMARAWIKGGWLNWAGYIFATACGMYTHYFMGFIILGQNLFAGYLWVRRAFSGSQKEVLPIRSWIIAQLAWVALFSPWLPTAIRQVQQGGGGWVAQAVGRPSWRVLWDVFMSFSIGPTRGWPPAWARYLSMAIPLLAALGGLWVIGDRRSGLPPGENRWPPRDGGVFCLALWAVPLAIVWLISQAKPIYHPRYVLPFQPALSLFLAAGVVFVGRRWRVAGLILAGLIVVFSLGSVYLQALTLQKPPWRVLVAHLLAESREGDVVVPEPFWNADPLRYYGADRLVIYDGMPWPATAESVERAAAEAAAGRRRLWLVEDTSHYSNRERLLAGYLNAHYPRRQVTRYPGIGEVALYLLSSEP